MAVKTVGKMDFSAFTDRKVEGDEVGSPRMLIGGILKRSAGWDALRVMLYVGLGITLLYLVLKLIGPFANAIIFGGIVAVMSAPLNRYLKSRHWGRSLRASVVTLTMFAVIVVPLSSFMVFTLNEGRALLGDNTSPEVLHERVTAVSNDLLAKAKQSLPAALSGQLSKRQVEQKVSQGIQSSWNIFLDTVRSVPDMLLTFFMGLLTLFFLVRDGEKLSGWLLNRVPLDSAVVDCLRSTIYNTTISATTIGFWCAAIQSAMIFGAFLLLDIPLVALATGAAFFLAWTPMIGVAPVWILGLVYLAFNGLWWQFVALSVIGVLISFVDNLVRLVGFAGRDTVHPLVGIFAVLGGMHWFGIMGIIIGPIIMAVSIALLDLFKKSSGPAGIVTPTTANDTKM